MPAIPAFVSTFIQPVSDGEKGLLDPYIQPVWSGIKNSIASLDLLKSNPFTVSKLCKLSAYSASAVAYATGNSQFGSKLINYATKGDDIINASFLLCDGSHLLSKGVEDWLDGMRQGAMLGAEMGGWALWLNSLGLIALTHTTAIAVVTGISLCVGFAIIGYHAYQKLESKDENEQKAAFWKTANAVSEVALHSLNVVGALLPAMKGVGLFRVGVMGLGVAAAGTCIVSALNPLQEKHDNPDMNPIRKVFDYLKKATHSVTGIHRSAKWTISFIHLAGLVSAVAGERFKALKVSLTTFKGLIDGTAFLSRVKEWSSYENEWKEWSWLKTLSQVGLTSGHFFKCLNFLDKVGIRKLGALSRTAFGSFRVVDIYGDGSILVNATFSIADTIKNMSESPDLEKLSIECQVNEAKAELWSVNNADFRGDKVAAEIATMNLIQAVKKEFPEGTTVIYDENDHNFIINSIKYDGTKIRNSFYQYYSTLSTNTFSRLSKTNWNQRKYWMTIANEVCEIAVISMAWITYGLGLGIAYQAAVSIIGFFTNSTGLAKYLIVEEMKEFEDNSQFSIETVPPFLPEPVAG